ncbi:MAG: pyridoxamine 5'-phosphate oxidase family protein [Candidatus Bipolaricaulia bacterium]
MGKLSAEELGRFLSLPWNGRLATVTPSCTPYVTPVWYEYDPSKRAFYVMARARSAYIEHIKKNPQVAFHIADDGPEHTRVLVEGTAKILEGPTPPSQSERLRALADRMARRYMGEEGPAYVQKTLDQPRYLLEVTPKKLTSWTGAGVWHPRYYQ